MVWEVSIRSMYVYMDVRAIGKFRSKGEKKAFRICWSTRTKVVGLGLQSNILAIVRPRQECCGCKESGVEPGSGLVVKMRWKFQTGRLEVEGTLAHGPLSPLWVGGLHMRLSLATIHKSV